MTETPAETPRELYIEVERPMTSGGAELPWGDVDVDVAHDTDGLPFLRRSTLSSRMRDASLDVVAARPDLLPAALELLGFAGAEHAAMLDVGTARIPEPVAAVLRAQPELDAVQILDAFTTVTVTTAVDSTGAPRSGSRRAIRAVNPGVAFSAALTWHTPPRAVHVMMLARVVLGLTQVGLGERRGRGRVCCSLDRDRNATWRLAQLSPEGKQGE